jgi:8-oxo-dGTP pyrophosphatase MutT (NUDIX family)
MQTPGKAIRFAAQFRFGADPWSRGRMPPRRVAQMSDPSAPPAFIDKIAWIHLHERRLLVARNAGRDRFYLPGGKREPGESDLETLVRELDEELTVTVDPGTAAYVGTFEALADARSDGLVVRLTCYTATHSGSLAPSHEIDEIAWLSAGDGHRVSAVDRLVLTHLRDAGLLG